MALDTDRHLTRRAIFGSLTIWLAVQFAHLLKPFGIPPFFSSSLLYAGLAVFPLLLLWPWMKDLLLNGRSKSSSRDPGEEGYLNMMVNFEIVVLSAMLLLLILVRE